MVPRTAAVFFDVDFTLIHPGPRFQGVGYQESCARHGVSADAAQFDAAVAAASALLESEDSLYDAELYRLKGEFLGRTADSKGAEAAFRRARKVAVQQGTLAFELRAATSLGRLLREQDRIDEARQLVAGVYGTFQEGFETRDLQDARRLLEELDSATILKP